MPRVEIAKGAVMDHGGRQFLAQYASQWRYTSVGYWNYSAHSGRIGRGRQLARLRVALLVETLPSESLTVGNVGSVGDLAVSPDGKLLVGGGHWLQSWDAETGHLREVPARRVEGISRRGQLFGSV